MADITFVSNPNGMGHVTRDYAITQHLPDISIKFVSASGAAQYLKQVGVNVEEVIDCPKLNVQNGLLTQPTRWLLKFYQYHKKCKDIALRLIEEENPRLMVSDEDYAALDVAQKQNIPSIAITNALELKFTKGFGSIIEKPMNRGMQSILKKCNAIIVPLDGNDHDNLRYVGSIVRSINNSREELREKFSFTKKTIVVSVGGTDAGDFLIEKTLEAHSKIKNDVDLIIVSGPSMKKDYGKNIRNLGYVDNLHEIIFAADLIICLAGASTVAESKTYGTPGIFIPIKDHFEQEDNARREGFSYDDVNRLDSLISQKLDEKRNPQANEGAKKAAEIIKKFVA
jgi:UDP-N-acetylglucosamine--N-acetylmuramyl-(pentapeptide) pyrophosphoryl-undecaprenol N-acetylglucosamine transferase